LQNFNRDSANLLSSKLPGNGLQKYPLSITNVLVHMQIHLQYCSVKACS